MTSLPTLPDRKRPVAGRDDRPDSKRAFLRYKFKGATFDVRIGKKRCDIRLKDLSCGGASGLLEEPVAVGDYVMIELDERHQVEALVCWVRRVMVGLQFVHPLGAAFIERCHELHGGRIGREEKDEAREEDSPRPQRRRRMAAPSA